MHHVLCIDPAPRMSSPPKNLKPASFKISSLILTLYSLHLDLKIPHLHIVQLRICPIVVYIRLCSYHGSTATCLSNCAYTMVHSHLFPWLCLCCSSTTVCLHSCLCCSPQSSVSHLHLSCGPQQSVSQLSLCRFSSP